jgi:hypothetical protein
MQTVLNAWTGGTLWLVLAGTVWLTLVPAVVTGTTFVGLNVLVLAATLTIALFNGLRTPSAAVVPRAVKSGRSPASTARQNSR